MDNKHKPNNDGVEYALVHSCPFSFAEWLEWPFPFFISSWQSTQAKDFHSLRFLQLTEQQMQSVIKKGSKNIDRLHPQNQSSKKEKLKRRRQITKRVAIERLALEEEFPVIFRKSQEGDDEVLAKFGQQTVRFCEHLLLLAKGGNEAAFGYLAELALKATRGIEQIHREKQFVVPTHITALEYAWPVMTSPVKTLSSNLSDWENLALGTDLGIPLDNKRRLKLNTPTGRLAWKLYVYVANLRQAAKQYYQPHSDGAKTRTSAKGLQTIEQQAACLEDFSKEYKVIASWWEVAERVLIQSFPSSEEHPDIKDIDRSHIIFAGISTNPSKILERLEEEFCSIARFKR